MGCEPCLAEQMRLRVTLLPTWYDVDTVQELAQLQAELAGLPPATAAHTRARLAVLAGERP